MTTERKVLRKWVRTAPQAEESSASSSEEGRSCIQHLQIAEMAKHVWNISHNVSCDEENSRNRYDTVGEILKKDQ
jgi:hypothetical protein